MKVGERLDGTRYNKRPGAYAIIERDDDDKLAIATDNIVKEYSIEKWIIEYHAFLDIFMESGRIVGFSLLLITGLLKNIICFKVLLLIVTASIPIYAKT